MHSATYVESQIEGDHMRIIDGLVKKDDVIKVISRIDTGLPYDDKDDIIEQAISSVCGMCSVEMLCVQPEEVIVLEYAYGETDIDMFHNLYRQVHSFFPSNRVLAVPNESSIKSASKIQLLELRQLLTDHIDELVESM